LGRGARQYCLTRVRGGLTIGEAGAQANGGGRTWRVIQVSCTPDRSNERALARYLKSIAARSPARFIVCSGHVHNYERFERDSVVYLVSGGGGAKPFAVFRGRADRYRKPGFPNFHYIRFELQGEHLTAEMVRLEDYNEPSPHTWATKDRFELWAKAR
jgi:hypothetical protein